jgi:hypothetical protein
MRTGLLFAAAMLSLASAAGSADAAQNWTIKGKVVVDHLLPELTEIYGNRSGLPEVTVKVSARSKIPLGWGTWNSWAR